MVKKSDKIVKINIGSGPHGKENWINLDWGILPMLSKLPWLSRFLVRIRLLPKGYDITWPSKPRLRDCRRGLPFANESIDFIYSSHFVEHLHRYKAAKLIAECKRVLRPSGVFRICVPDVEQLAEKYLQRDKDFFSVLDGPGSQELENDQLDALSDKFVQHFYGFDLWSRPSRVQRIQRIFTRGHFWMYDFESLKNILSDSGFSHIKRYKARQGTVPDIDFLDLHTIGSLFIEARND